MPINQTPPHQGNIDCKKLDLNLEVELYFLDQDLLYEQQRSNMMRGVKEMLCMSWNLVLKALALVH